MQKLQHLAYAERATRSVDRNDDTVRLGSLLRRPDGTLMVRLPDGVVVGPESPGSSQVADTLRSAL